jgi:3-hydroxyisobutyrate dehydrogenase
MKVGFIGLGNVGGKLAASLLRNGIDLTVRDIDRNVANPFIQQGAHWVDSPRALAQQVEVIITCLPSPAISAAVMEAKDGVISGMRENQVWLEMSTTDEAEVKRLAELVEHKGASALDSPVSGGCHRAASGNISIFTGGDRAAFEKVLPILCLMGRQILHTGPLGSASVLKVISNYLASVHLTAIGEALTVADQAGMDLATSYEAIRISSGNSFVHETESQVILNGSYNINFTMDLVIKDLGLFDALAQRQNVPVELSPVVLEIFKQGAKKYGGQAWSSQIVKRLEDACGTKLRAPGFPEQVTDDEPETVGSEVRVNSCVSPLA